MTPLTKRGLGTLLDSSNEKPKVACLIEMNRLTSTIGMKKSQNIRLMSLTDVMTRSAMYTKVQRYQTLARRNLKERRKISEVNVVKKVQKRIRKISMWKG